MGKKRLLIIGAGIEQIRAYEMAHAMGIETVGSDINPNAPALEFADYKLIASTRNVEETFQAVNAFNFEHKLDGVMTLANDVPLTVASVAAQLNLPGISIESAMLTSEKLAMKNKLQLDGIPVPPFKEISSPDQIIEVASDWGFPLVIKPNDGRGARGVLRITKDTDVKWAFEHALENSESGRVIVEKFIEGRQLSTESMVYRNHCYPASIADRNYELIDSHAPYIIENGGDLPANISKEEIKAVDEIIARTAESVGILNGTIKGDVVLSKNGPVIIEVAARLSGGYFCTDQIPLSRGVDLVKQTIKLALGEELDVSELIPKDLCRTAIRYFFPPPGRIVSIRNFEDLDRYDWIAKKLLFLKVGDIVEPITNHTKRAGFVITTGKTAQEAKERATWAINRIIIETTPNKA